MKPLLLTQRITTEMMLDDFLTQCYFSKKQKHLLKMEKRIIVNHKIITHNIHLYPEDLIEINCMKEECDSITPVYKDLKILYEDEVVLIIDKPIHMIIHDDSTRTETLDQIVKGYYEKSGQQCPVRHIHRLDRDTSGCILYCKQSYLQPYFDHAMETKQIKRTYLAIVQGKIAHDLTIDQNIGKDRHMNRYRVSKSGVRAITHVRPIKYRNGKTLVECELETGRTHQIRVHLSSISHPLIGDELYGKKDDMRCALHSHKLSFIHPLTHKKITVISEMPKDMVLCMK